MDSNNYIKNFESPDNSIEILLLGAAQDGGYPQFGCKCKNCSQCFNNTNLSDSAVSIAIIDKKAKKWWLLDASPQLAQQWAEFAHILFDYEIAGIILTHAHAGHYTGLLYFGKECLNANQIPVYASFQMHNYLQKNEPWAVMYKNKNLVPVEIKDSISFQLSDLVKVTPHIVSHRADFTDTFAFKIFGPLKNCFYCPDIDSWDGLSESLPKIAQTMDILLLDATFYDDNELPGRDMKTIPHPRVIQTVELLSRYKFNSEIFLIHINHSNKLWVDKEEILNLLQNGIKVGRKGIQWQL